nr:PREDICTED: uncharacterized protein LOC109041627 [Bemisia tabaci]
MRILARLLLEMRLLREGKFLTFTDCIDPSNFDYLVAAAKNLCGCSSRIEDRDAYQKPSLVLKVGPSLQKAACIIQGTYLRMFGEEPEIADIMNKKVKAFLTLMKTEWTVRVSSTAHANVFERKFNKAELLPLTSDIMNLRGHLDKTIKESRVRLTSNPTYENYRKLAVYLLTSTILFNRRRSGEASKMKIEQYKNRVGSDKQTTEELKQSFSPLEIVLCKRMCVVDIHGKKGSKVPTILNETMQEAIDELINVRETVGINEGNPYVFATIGRFYPLSAHLKGCDCVNFCVEACDPKLTSPRNVTGTKLRKHVATVCQIFDLSESELDWVAKHMGHDIRVHRQYYRLHESARELTKVSRLLLAVENGMATQFIGKKLDEIDLQDLPLLSEETAEGDDHDLAEPEVEEENNEGNNSGLGANQEDISTVVGESGAVDEHKVSCSGSNYSDEESDKEALSRAKKNQPNTRNSRRGKKTHKSKNLSVEKRKGKDKQPVANLTDESSDEEPAANEKRGTKRQYQQKHVRWTEEEKMLLFSFFKRELRRGDLLKKARIDEFIETHPQMSKRPWKNIKFYYKFQLMKIKKIAAESKIATASIKDYASFAKMHKL